jgi:two-component system sensor histidine kinase BaeS
MAAAVDREERLRRQLVADVAHEVRTPLTILRATAEGLVDGVLPADQTTLESLHEEVLRLTQLVADLETLAAADAAGLQLDRTRIDLADAASAAVDAMTAMAPEGSVPLTTTLDPAPAEADERRIHQILINLLTNAVRYSPPGASITVETGRLPDGPSFVRVTDSGPGLSDDDITHVFDRFYRGSAAQGTEGSGLGLAIAAELAAAHGGRLTATKAAPGGACFMLTLAPTAR